MNKEHPILMSTPMVQALLEGRKTQTRRVIKGASQETISAIHDRNNEYLKEVCPYGKPGDRLWVREMFRYCKPYHPEDLYYEYKAYDILNPIGEKVEGLPYHPNDYDRWWRPSIHMPKAACRIWLEVVDIRVQRLHEITREECLAEGVDEPLPFAKSGFASLWYSIHKKEPYEWYSNPWVWVVEFKRI